MKAINKRWGVGIFAVLLFAGCSKTGDQSVEKRNVATQTAPVLQETVNWMGHWLTEHDREKLVREVAKEFEVVRPYIKLNLKFPVEILGERSKVKTAAFIVSMIKSGKIDWDIVWMDHDIYQMVAEELNDPFWGKEHLVDFRPLAEFKGAHKSFITEDPVYRKQSGGILVGPYIEGYYYGMYYNKKVASMLGLNIKGYGMTFDDLLSYVKKIYDYNNEHNTIIAAFYEAQDWATVEILFQNLFKSLLNDFIKAKAEIGSVEKNTALLKVFQSFEKLGKYRPLSPSWRSAKWFDTRKDMLEDKYLFYINGVWMYNHWMSIDTEKIKNMIPVELPVFQEVDYYLGGYISSWAVMKHSSRKDAAIELLLFWSRPQVAEKWVRYTKAPTGLRGHISSPDIGDDQFERFQAHLTEKYGGNIHYSANAGYILGDANSLLQKEINDVLHGLLEGSLTAQQGYDNVMQKVKSDASN